MAFLEGYLAGLAMIIFIGPVFFTLLHSTFLYGSKAGFAVVLGIFISDVLVVSLCSFGPGNFYKNTNYQLILAFTGSVMLFYMGLKYIFKPSSNTAINLEPSVIGLSAFFTKGFLVNFVNPFVFIVWISVVTYANVKYEQQSESLLFFAAALMGIITTDSLKVLLAKRILNFLKPEILQKLFFVFGIILVCFGIRLLYFFWSH